MDYVEAFTGPNIEAIQSMLINKPPDTGSGTSSHPMHQDLLYSPIRPADKIVGTWTAMDAVTVENGCLYVVPGTHKFNLKPHHYPDNEVKRLGFQCVKGFDDLPKVDLLMEKGDCLLFHPLLFHGAHPNLSQVSKLGLDDGFKNVGFFRDSVKLLRALMHPVIVFLLKRKAQIKISLSKRWTK